MVVDFEDAVAAASDADLLPVPLTSRRTRVKAALHGRPDRPVSAPRHRYDLCLLVAMASDALSSLRYVRGLRRVASRVAVYLFDSWASELPRLRKHRGIWSLVDDLFVSFPHALDPYSENLPCRVHYLPQAINPRWFHPYRTERPIDVLSVGRRAQDIHMGLLEISRKRDLFYYYQTHAAPLAIDFRENQELLGRLSQSARVHVNWSVDRTSPDRVRESSAITARWFESAASGAAVIGSAPQGEEFARLFPYERFVRHVRGTNPAAIEAVLDAALADTNVEDRVALAEHVRQVHTWDVRWRQIAEICGV
jgi:hypothetical protein